MRSRDLFIAAAALIITVRSALAGPLTPPAGPVAPTFKTMSQVEPRTPISASTTPGDADSLYRITAPGSYYLTGNIVGQDGKHGIEIASGGVTIDLGGFDLYGGGSPGTLDGIRTASSNLVNITITNGSVRSWGGDGIDLGTNPAHACRLEGISASLNGRTGILAGSGVVLDRCVARSNGVSGAQSLAGIEVGSGCTISGCVAQLNTGVGIFAGASCSITGCTAESNTRDGIRASSGSTIIACTARNNAYYGIHTADLFFLGNGVTVADCAAEGNSIGIRGEAGCAIVRCTARANGYGINIYRRCVARGNTCADNTVAGIHAGGSTNVIDGNTCIDNPIGIEVTFGGNLIIRNACTGTTWTQWSIAEDNRLGPIVSGGVNREPIQTSGSAPGTLNTTDPFANITY